MKAEPYRRVISMGLTLVRRLYRGCDCTKYLTEGVHSERCAAMLRARFEAEAEVLNVRHWRAKGASS